MSFPIHRAHYRTLDPTWEGEVFIADIDRTYLATEIENRRGMARIPFERAVEKIDIAGMAQLFREIRRGPGVESRQTPLFFVSASPSQLRSVIERKMRLDGIGFDGTTFKDWKRVVRGLRWRRLREQVGFKLTALLAGRAVLPCGAIETLVGDDLETDPVAFALYADVLAGRIPREDLTRILLLNGVMPRDAAAIVSARDQLADNRGVRRVLIRMERFSDPDVFKPFGPGLIGCLGAFQMAAALMHEGSLSQDGVIRVAIELLARGTDPGELTEHLCDLYRRALLTHDEFMTLSERMTQDGLITPIHKVGEPDAEWVQIGQSLPGRLWTPGQYTGEA